ncbi:MAG: hypothetical protein KAS32_19455 [Candidatus Peribacteraceae bacterium]|nr:hypothetical protein [Candidatus Peribacteraceae bacterium]
MILDQLVLVIAIEEKDTCIEPKCSVHTEVHIFAFRTPVEIEPNKRYTMYLGQFFRNFTTEIDLDISFES